MCRRVTMSRAAWPVQPRFPAREPGKGVAPIPRALPISWNRTMPARWMIPVAVGLWLLVLSGCTSEPGGRPLAETAAPVGITPTPALSPIPTFTPVSSPGDRARTGGPPLASATPVPSVAEAESCPAVGPSPSLHCDKEVLLALRYRLWGEHRAGLRTWRQANPIEVFEGVSLGDDPRRVIGLELSGRRPYLRGILRHGPSQPLEQLSRLPLLQRLVLRENDLTGSIPPELGQLTKLAVLDLADNGLTGSIPAELGQLTGLQELNLSQNRLQDSIPAELGQLTGLRDLHLQVNWLTGPMPPELGRLAQLERLNLSINLLTGPIPPELGRLSQLERLDLSTNELTGSIPPELGQLSHLKQLDLGTNELTGSIPPELGRLTQLERLNLGANELTGSISPELGQLADLKHLHLGGNHLEGTVPVELGQLTHLQELRLRNNRLTGPIPPELVQLSALTYLDLGANRLTGPIPPALDRLPALEYMGLANNQLMGPVPSVAVAESCPVAGPSPSLHCDKALLLAMRHSLRGSYRQALRTWHADNAIEDFEGVSLGDDPRRVTGLEIRELWSPERPTRSPSLPQVLGRMSRLQRLVLPWLLLGGAIPRDLGNLPNCRYWIYRETICWVPSRRNWGSLPNYEYCGYTTTTG